MAKNPITTPHKQNVFLDTQVFDAFKHNYASRNLQTLISLCQDGSVSLFLTEVTVGEIESHLRDIARGLKAAVKKLASEFSCARQLKTPPLPAIFGATDFDAVHKELRENFDAFCRSTAAHTLPINVTTPQEIMDEYFRGAAPFGPGRQKEFPDAFASASLRAWCEANKDTINVVSCDADWVGICEAHPTLLKHFRTLQEFLSLFPDPTLVDAIKDGLSPLLDSIKSEIADQYTGTSFHTPEVDGDVEDVEVTDVSITDTLVTSAAKGKARITIECEIEYQATVNYIVPGTGSWDSEDHVLRFPEEASHRTTDTDVVTAEVSVQYDPTQPTKVKVEEIDAQVPWSVEVRCDADIV